MDHSHRNFGHYTSTTTLSRGRLVLAMYTLESASIILGTSQSTVKRWMGKFHIEGKLLTIDNKRRYLSEDDLLTLIDHANRNKPENPVKQEMLKKYRIETEVNSLYQEDGEEKLYSFADAASFLDASTDTVRKWVAQHHIKRTKITTNRPRMYISHTDVLMLARLHSRKLPDTGSLNIVQEIQEIRSELKAHAAAIEDMKHDLRVYIKRSIYIPPRE